MRLISGDSLQPDILGRLRILSKSKEKYTHSFVASILTTIIETNISMFVIVSVSVIVIAIVVITVVSIIVIENIETALAFSIIITIRIYCGPRDFLQGPEFPRRAPLGFLLWRSQGVQGHVSALFARLWCSPRVSPSMALYSFLKGI